jgi:DNA-binding MarR family transcriptional regulator
VDTEPDEDRLDLDVLDAVGGLFARLLAEAETLARDYGVPAFVLKALHMIDAPLAMKELGSRMRCDPSFITGIADTLEGRGLAARESDPADRRVKRLVLTSAGVELRQQMERRMAARMPWRGALTAAERRSLLELLRKMMPPLPCPAEGRPASTQEASPAGTHEASPAGTHEASPAGTHEASPAGTHEASPAGTVSGAAS